MTRCRADLEHGVGQACGLDVVFRLNVRKLRDQLKKIYECFLASSIKIVVCSVCINPS